MNTGKAVVYTKISTVKLLQISLFLHFSSELINFQGLGLLDDCV